MARYRTELAVGPFERARSQVFGTLLVGFSRFCPKKRNFFCACYPPRTQKDATRNWSRTSTPAALHGSRARSRSTPRRACTAAPTTARRSPRAARSRWQNTAALCSCSSSPSRWTDRTPRGPIPPLRTCPPRSCDTGISLRSSPCSSSADGLRVVAVGASAPVSYVLGFFSCVWVGLLFLPKGARFFITKKRSTFNAQPFYCQPVWGGVAPGTWTHIVSVALWPYF